MPGEPPAHLAGVDTRPRWDVGRFRSGYWVFPLVFPRF